MKYHLGDYGQSLSAQELGAGLIDSIITPDVKQSIISAAKNGAIEGVKFVWQEYKTPIVLVSVALAATFILENMANAKILAKKG
jgi:hypothetical protein